jgi:MFS family permease
MVSAVQNNVANRDRLGPFLLAEDITRKNALSILFASFCTIGLVTFLNFMNPYLFEILGIPADRQGSLAGLLVALQEATQLAICGFIGAWSDRIGRRPVYVGALVTLAIGFALYPLAPDEYSLIALRIFYAVGATAATVMLSTCIGEYIDDSVRGRWVGASAVANALGIVAVVSGVSKLPRLFNQLGLDNVLALRVSFWLCAGALLLLALILHRGLQSPRAATTESRESLLSQALKGFTQAREDPKLALSYLTAFASKGDLVIMTTFISLWVTQAGVAAGMPLGDAIARAGMIFGITAGAALIWPLFMGQILDRVPRLVSIGFAFALASASYTCLALVDDALGRTMIYAAIFAGVGESSAVISAGTLIGQTAPARNRGVAFGTYSFAGSAGILILSYAGGLVFDAFGAGAPFLMMGTVNVVVAAVSWLLFLRLRNTNTEALEPKP